ncbi:cytochrome c oxidase assembly protein [Catellatospora methionotrophica]|uniref:cytochrome c oxidase assembly protein n=1 Tax=Catellatospora methionotrophica TaxID=121620 RepID=UPI0033EEBDA6
MSAVTRRVVPAAAVACGLGAATLALLAGGQAAPVDLPGLGGPGPLTSWALPVSRVAGDLAATAVVGLLLGAAALSPRLAGHSRTVGPAGYRWLKAAAWCAVGWLMCVLSVLVFTTSDLLGVPVSSLPAATFVSFALDVEQGRALLVSAAGAAMVAVAATFVLRARSVWLLLCAAAVAVCAPVFTGHAAGGDNHQLAVSSLLIHVAAAVLWAGGLLALVTARRLPAADLHRAVARFSRLALWCAVAVAASGAAGAAARLTSWSALTSTTYGLLLSIKTVAVLALAGCGLWQRRRALPHLAAGRPGVFARLAAVEVLLFAAVMGLAAVLSRTPAPESGTVEDPAVELLGFAMPAPFNLGNVVTAWLPEPLFIAAALAATVAYGAAVWRLHARGDRWPALRLWCWLGGWALVVVATSSGLARYGPLLFSVHMTQHLILAMIAPMLLVLAAPVTLALRALRPDTDPLWPGPRTWLTGFVHGRLARLAAHPLVALALYAGSLYAVYMSGLYEAALRSHALHLLLYAHFLAAGYLFFWVVMGADRAPRPLAYPLRLIVLLASMAMHALFGLIVMQSGSVIAADWYAALPRDWGASPLDEQRLGGGIAWSLAEVPAAVAAVALLLRWSRADRLEATRLDRAMDRAEDRGEDSALDTYNRMLAQLAADDAARQSR